EVRDVYVHVTKETDAGIYVSGAKQVATASALTHASFVASNSGTAARFQEGKDEDFALVFFARMDNPGQTLVCRRSHEKNGQSPFDGMRSGRFDESGAVRISDSAFIAWEDVLVYRNAETAKGFYAASGFFTRFI